MALDLNRNLNQYVILPRSLNLSLNTSFTVSAWLLSAGYLPKTILSDCNDYNAICITFLITDTSINIRLSNWDDKKIIQEIVTSVEDLVCQNCWIYVSFSFDSQTKWATSYFNGVQYGSTYMNLSDTVPTRNKDPKRTYIGLNTVTSLEPFYGLIDELSITYDVKNASEILSDATLLFQYNFNTDNINGDTGPSSTEARSQNVYQITSNNIHSILFNGSDSYFQSSGFTLVNSNFYEYSINFWLRVIISKPNKINSAITIFQMTSLISGLSANSYSCVVSLHIYPDNQTLGVFFPQLFDVVNINNSSIKNDTWIHIGMIYNNTLDSYLFYQDGKLIYSHFNRRFLLLITNNPRCSVTIGGAYLNDSLPNKPDNFEQMKCFAQLPIFNYTNMYGEIASFRIDARALSESELMAIANPNERQ